jgi:VCBS repeat-containing protein
METHVKRLRVPAISLLLAALVLIPSHVTLNAGNPGGAFYRADTDKVFWFIHASDLHVGTSGSTDTSNLQWLVTTAREVIGPSFIVVTGDLTDSTNGNIFGYPNGPYQAEWDQYKSLLSSAGVNASFYYDIPGNHDAYNDRYFAYYLANSIQGRATGKTQVSWTRIFPFGTYHFLGVNSADNTGDSFSLVPPYGDHAGLDLTELAFVNSALAANAGAALTMVFGHHPVTSTGSSSDTYLYYGHQAFIDALDSYSASEYGYGHTHANSETQFAGNGYTGLMTGDGIRYSNVSSLGKDSPNSYSLVAIDCNGVSSVTRSVGSWPVVLITAPVNRLVGTAVNPYAYTVPPASNNPIRALVFDQGAIAQVQYRVDGGAWHPMSRVPANPDLWTGTWDASGLTAANHTLEVQATGSSTVSDTISVEVTAGVPNQPPTANPDTYSTDYQTTLNVAAPGVLANDSDPEGKALTAALVEGPAHGTLTLNANGSFTYTPATSYSGPDSFTYTASDGTLVSAPVMVSITVAPAPVTDKVTIVSATYNAKRRQLSVTATSSVQPNATLTVEGYGTMTYKAKTRTYAYTVSGVSKPATVTVKSSRGGSATASVT